MNSRGNSYLTCNFNELKGKLRVNSKKKTKKENKKYATTKWKELLDILLSISRDDVWFSQLEMAIADFVNMMDSGIIHALLSLSNSNMFAHELLFVLGILKHHLTG